MTIDTVSSNTREISYEDIYNETVNGPIIFKRSNNDWEYNNKNLGEYILKAFESRETYPTANNRESSRSHVIVCLDYYQIIII